LDTGKAVAGQNIIGAICSGRGHPELLYRRELGARACSCHVWIGKKFVGLLPDKTANG
jgi:hypothetical protein